MPKLTPEERNEIIAKIPEEGSLRIPDENDFIQFAASDLEAKVDRFFEGKTPPKPKDQKATILMGPQGSGKSFFARADYFSLPADEFTNTIYVSYDETGALFEIPGYVHELQKIVPDFNPEYPHQPVSKDTLAIRKALWEKFRPFSQKIREHVLKRALKEGYSIIVDTTSSSPGTEKLIDTLNALGIKDITIKAMFAPWNISMDRVDTRARPENTVNRVTKRKGFLQMFPKLYYRPQRFELYYNPVDGQKPELACAQERGHMAAYNPELIYKIHQDLRDDSSHIRVFRNNNAEFFSDDPYTVPHYSSAANNLNRFWKSLAGQEFDQPPEPLF